MWLRTRASCARTVFVVWLGLWTIGAPPALAQSTGGSFGGGDWGSSSSSSGGGSYGGGGGSYGGSSSSYGGSSSSSSSDWSYDDDDDSGGDSDPLGTLFVLLLGAAIWLVSKIYEVIRDGIRSVRSWGRGVGGGADPTPGNAGRVWNGVDVTGISLAIDWRARPYVQQELDAMARTGLTSSAEGRAQLLRKTAELLLGVRLAWLYGGVRNFRPMNQSAAQGVFRQLAVQARAAFDRDTIRDEQGTLTIRDAGPLTARPEEGPGVVVVTLVVAARVEILDVAAPDDAFEVTNLITSFRRIIGRELVALEVIWSPAVEEDRMSTAELTARYPDLKRFTERSIGGRVFCGYCAAPFADELPTCPHCGAPNPRHLGQPAPT